MATVGVVMVTFRGGDSVARSLDALSHARAAIGPGHGVFAVVADNASGDGTVGRIERHAPWADVIELARNDGFAAGCNVAIERLGAVDVIVLLNPDVVVNEDFFTRVTELEWPEQLAARGPAIRNAAGQLEQSARGFPRARTGLLGRTSLVARVRPGSRVLRGDLMADSDGGPRTVDWVSGACMIAPADRFRSIGLLDAGYYMYWEDADWCRRAADRGFRVVYEPDVVVTHHQGSSTRYRAAPATIAFHRSALRYWRKHVARTPASSAAVAAALSLRCALKLASLVARRGLVARTKA